MKRMAYDYQTLAEWYDARYMEMGGTWHIPVDECNRHLDDLGVPSDPTLSLLDIGCRGGHLIEQAAQRVSCVGLEISSVALSYARARIMGCPVDLHPVLLANVPIEAYTKESALFDFVVSIGSLEQLMDLPLALKNVHRALKPDGRWYFFMVNPKRIRPDKPAESWNNEDWWRGTLARQGLDTTSVVPWDIDRIAYQGIKRSV